MEFAGVPDWVFLHVLAPSVDDLIDRHIQFGCFLACLDFFDRQGSLFGRLLLWQVNCLAGCVCEVDAFGAVVAGELGRVVGWISQEQWFTVPVAAVVYGKGTAGIDADADFGCGDLLIIVTSLGEHVDDELGRGDSTMDTLSLRVGFAVVGLGEQRMQPLAVEGDSPDVNLVKDTLDRTVVLIEKAQRALVAIGPLDLRDVEHIVKVKDIRIHVNAVDTVGHIRRDRLQRHVARVILDRDVFHIGYLPIDVFGGAVMVPVLAH